MDVQRKQVEDNSIVRIDNMTRRGSIDLVYYNMVFTENEVILDFMNRSFRTWILRIKPYKELSYIGLDINEIKNRSKENMTISYAHIESLKFNSRTFIKNAFIEIEAKGIEGKLRLFSRENVDLDIAYDLMKKRLASRVSMN